MNLLSILPSALVVGGWIIVYQLQALQARRKVLREEVEKTRTAVVSLTETALRFHMKPHSVEDQMQILASITDIERRYAMFPKIAAGRSRWLPDAVQPVLTKINPELLIRLRQAITLEHFDDPQLEPLPYGSRQLTDIGNESRRLVSAIDEVLIASLD